MRALGALLLAIAGLAGGVERARELTRRCRLTAALASSLELLRGEVAHMERVDRAAERLARAGPPEARGFFALFAAGLEALGEREVAEIWDAAARTLPLAPPALEALLAAGRSLGRYGADEQLAALSRGVEALARLAEEERARAENGRRLYAGAGLALGLIAAIMLY